MLKEIESELIQLNKELIRLAKEYDDNKQKIEYQISRLIYDKEIIMSGYDLEKIRLAKEVMDFDMKKYSDENEGLIMINRGINDICDGYKSLKKYYYGCKDYDRYYNQGVTCDYGYSPRHGSVQWRYGLKEKYQGNNIELITDEQTDAILYVLNLIKISDKLGELL